VKVPNGMTFHAPGGPYREGDDVPDDIVASLPSDHPLKTAQAPSPREIPRAAPRPADDKGK
jgi:hypothetical protein